jgi:AcrR family transcriptional regulator
MTDSSPTATTPAAPAAAASSASAAMTTAAPLPAEPSAADVEERFDFPVEDPAQTLPGTAQRLLEAARRLLLAGGYDALRLDAIAAEAGKNKASIKYYFGNKEGLIAAIVDSLDYDDCLALAEETRGTSGDERLQRYIAGQTRLAGDDDSFLMFFDLLPYIIRDEQLRRRLASLYEWYYKMNAEWLGLTDRIRPENRERFIAFASLMTATVDGLAIQAALRPKGFDLEQSFAVLQFFLKRSLNDFLATLDEPGGADSD